MTATQEIAKVLHRYLVDRTPIKTGNLRKMWSAGDNLKFTVTPLGNGYEVVLINEAKTDKDFPYGVAVNDGHRTPSGGWVMGRFFVEAAILQAENSSEISTVVGKELEKWWDSV